MNFDEHKSSPVSGTFIRDSDSEDEITSHSPYVRRSGDIDPSLNVVVITEEARAEIAKIDNKIGDYICKLCKEKFNDVFGLAQHRCTRIRHVEYRCPECDKVFNCPANLASHRRWHKPRNGVINNGNENGKNGKNGSKVSVIGTATIHSEQNNTSDCSIDTNQSNESQPEGQYECECCSKKFRRSAYLKKHLLTVHNIDIDIENNKPKESDEKKIIINNKSLKRKQKNAFDLTDSVNNSSNNEKELIRNDFKYRCLVCSVVFQNEISLELHNKSVHINDSFGCRFCQTILFSEADLTIHINKYHLNRDNNESILQSVVKHELT